jgi:hypothetical protein
LLLNFQNGFSKLTVSLSSFMRLNCPETRQVMWSLFNPVSLFSVSWWVTDIFQWGLDNSGYISVRDIGTPRLYHHLQDKSGFHIASYPMTCRFSAVGKGF